MGKSYVESVQNSPKFEGEVMCTLQEKMSLNIS